MRLRLPAGLAQPKNNKYQVLKIKASFSRFFTAYLLQILVNQYRIYDRIPQFISTLESNISIKISSSRSKMAIFQVIIKTFNRNRKFMTFNREWKMLPQQQRHLVATMDNSLKHQPINLFERLPLQRVNTCFNALCVI